MKTFSGFIVEAAGQGFANMTDADFERWTKEHPAAAEKARKVRAEFMKTRKDASQKPPQSTPQRTGFRIPRPTAGQAAVGALNVGIGALDYKGRRDVGQSRVQAGTGAAASAAGGQLGWAPGAKIGATLGSRFGPKGAAIGGVTGGLLGGMGGSAALTSLADRMTGVTKQQDIEKVGQQYGMRTAKKRIAATNTYGATKGSALTGLGGPTKVDTTAGTLTTKGKTVKLASTQLVRDPKTGQQRVGDLAYRGGKPVYVARPSTASRDSNATIGGALRNLQRGLNIGGQRQRDAEASKKEYRTALSNTQAYTKGLGISTKSATAQKLPGYGTAPTPKPAARPASRPAGGGMGGRRGGSVKR